MLYLACATFKTEKGLQIRKRKQMKVKDIAEDRKAARSSTSRPDQNNQKTTAKMR